MPVISTIRDFHVFGPTMVLVKGGSHMSGRAIARRTELGLSVDEISVRPQFRHRDIRVDDWGAEIPVEIMWQLSDVIIDMTLVHYDRFALDVCYNESMGGSYVNWYQGPNSSFARITAGRLMGAGVTLGKGLPILASGCNFVSLNLTAQNGELPFRFPASYLIREPHVVPMGTETSKVQLTWRAIPYRPLWASGIHTATFSMINIAGIGHTPREFMSSGVRLWDRELDTEGEVRTFDY